MSKNNTIRKSDKKFIRLEKSRIREQFSDAKKQEELINALYARFSGKPKSETPAAVEKPIVKAETVKEEKPAAVAKKAKVVKDKKVKTAKAK